LTTQAALSIMRTQKSGLVVNMSSGRGGLATPGSAYVGTKFAVEGISESMSFELEPFGIKTVIIEPGLLIPTFLMLYRYQRNLKILVLHMLRQ
jgi:NAD(P)-dependent dehydrogenase (short-subunit alcohol dehydrogenase family)